jgi:hypothetical protein
MQRIFLSSRQVEARTDQNFPAPRHRRSCLPDPADKASPRHFETGRTAARTPDPWRSRTAVLIGRLLITLVLLPISPSVGALQPLEAPDTSSPRATFESFLALSDEAAHSLPFPDFTEAYRKRVTDTLDYPPEGSPKADRG